MHTQKYTTGLFAVSLFLASGLALYAAPTLAIYDDWYGYDSYGYSETPYSYTPPTSSGTATHTYYSDSYGYYSYGYANGTTTYTTTPTTTNVGKKPTATTKVSPMREPAAVRIAASKIRIKKGEKILVTATITDKANKPFAGKVQWTAKAGTFTANPRDPKNANVKYFTAPKKAGKIELQAITKTSRGKLIVGKKTIIVY